MYLFSIPDSYFVRTINKAFIFALKEHPEWFYDDFQIETAYGCPPSCIWNGNRIAMAYISQQDWNKVISMYYDANIRYRLTFTNFLLQPEHLYDTYANSIAAHLNNFGGYVMVSIPLLANYMRRYPNLKICWSTTTDFGKDTETQIKKINELSEDNLVVIPYEFNNKPELERFTHPENLEVLVNEYCIDNCPKRRLHWTENNKCALYIKDNAADCFFGEGYSPEPKQHTVTREMLRGYLAKGINHFKISGRLDPTQTAGAYFEFFVRREFYQEIMDYFVKQNDTNFGEGWN